MPLAEVLVLAVTAGAGRMPPPTSTRISAILKYVQGHSSPVNILAQGLSQLYARQDHAGIDIQTVVQNGDRSLKHDRNMQRGRRVVQIGCHTHVMQCHQQLITVVLRRRMCTAVRWYP